MEEIVKYPNRKLYSKTQSRYVTLSDIKDVVNEGRLVQVLTKDGKNITAETLKKVVALTDAKTDELEALILRS
jgi:polyhydroxyalkanoate synthesis regulator protein